MSTILSSPRIRRAVVVADRLLAAVVAAGRAATPGTVQVWFLQGEQVIAVERPGETVENAVRALLAGPTPAVSDCRVRA